MQFYRVLKRFIYLFSEKIIQASHRYIWRTIFIPERDWKRFVHKGVIYLRDIGKLIQDSFRIPAYLVDGKEWRIVFVGNEFERLEVEHLFFAGARVEWQKIEDVFIWKKGKDIKKWISEGVDLVIYEVSRILPLSRGVEYRFVVPTQICQVLPLPENAKVLLGGKSMKTERNEINKSERNGYSYQFSEAKSDFDQFYHEMYVPYVSKRHGTRVQVEGYEAMLKRFQHGGLLMITKGESIVARSLIYMLKDTVYVTEYGVNEWWAEGKNDISLLIYWYSILWGYSQHAKEVDLGGSLGWCSNGIFKAKKRWNTQVKQFQYFYNFWHVYAGSLTSERLEALNRIGFITEYKKTYYRVFLQKKGTTCSENEMNQILEVAQYNGLRGAVQFSPLAKNVINLGSH
jgi:hypothetical protein